MHLQNIPHLCRRAFRKVRRVNLSLAHRKVEYVSKPLLYFLVFTAVSFPSSAAIIM